MNPLPLTLGPELTIPFAAEAQATLLQALADGQGPLALDLATVGEFDSAGVQLLLAARRSAAEAGRPLQLVAASEAVREALQVYGLLPLFEAQP